jgi:ketol-acid reductoisomerase
VVVTIYTQKDANPAALGGRRIAILGYGSQGRSHALNLRDSGFEVVVGARAGGAGERKARADFFPTLAPAEAVAEADLVALLVPDLAHRQVYEQDIAPRMKRGATLLVGHGFSVHYHEIDPRHDIDVVLVAPKGSGALLRRDYELGRGLPCLFAVRQDASGSARARALAYAWGIGGTMGGAIETSFAEETETDLFGEQAVRCGGKNCELASVGFDILVEAGYQPEVAAFACRFATGNAPDVPADPRHGEDEVRTSMAELLKAIQSGEFARDWIARLSNQPETRAA